MDRSATALAPDLDRDALLVRLRALRPAFEREGITHMWLIDSRARGDNRADVAMQAASSVFSRLSAKPLATCRRGGNANGRKFRGAASPTVAINFGTPIAA